MNNILSHNIQDFTYLELILENTDCIKVNVQDVNSIFIDDVKYSIEKIHSNCFSERFECSSLALIISQNANVQDNNKSTCYPEKLPFERLLTFLDVVYIRLGNDTRNIDIYVPYDGVEVNNFNHTFINKNGDLVITIGDVNNER